MVHREKHHRFKSTTDRSLSTFGSTTSINCSLDIHTFWEFERIKSTACAMFTYDMDKLHVQLFWDSCDCKKACKTDPIIWIILYYRSLLSNNLQARNIHNCSFIAKCKYSFLYRMNRVNFKSIISIISNKVRQICHLYLFLVTRKCRYRLYIFALIFV